MTLVCENEGVRVQEAPTCYFCGVEGQSLYSGLRDRLFGAPGTWDLRCCPSCGLVWLDPQPIPEDIGKLYAEYFTHSIDDAVTNNRPSIRKSVKRGILSAGFGYKDIAKDWKEKAVGQMFSKFSPFREKVGGSVMWLDASKRGCLLDVGCGNGQFLANMRDLGWEVVGVEPDPEAVRVAREMLGLQVYQGTLAETNFPPNSFDAVTMSHVIEHVNDPVSLLVECNRVLKPGGHLALVTPNIDSLGARTFDQAWLHWDPPRHLLLFSPSTLKRCVESAGLRIRELRTPSSEAPQTWMTSRLLRRDGVIPEGRVVGPGLTRRLEAIAFLALEHLTRIVRPRGEEVVIVASKEDTEP